MTTYIGIDPATRTGVAAMDEAGDVLWAALVREEAFDHYYHQCVAHLAAQGLLGASGPILAAVEAQYIGCNRATSIALARRAAVWECALVTCGADGAIRRPQPSQWRAALGLPTRDRDGAKVAAVERARLEHGWETTSDDVAEAIMIAEWVRRQHV